MKPEARKINKAIGERVRELRMASGVSQQEMGGALGVSFQQIAKYELGRSRVSAAALVLSAQKLRCEIAQFYKTV